MPTVTGDNFYINKHTLQFRTGETGVASIVYDKTDESISIANAGTGQISIGDAGGDIYIGDGTTETDIIFEQNGAIRALANKTLKLGQGDSDVKVEAQNFLVTGDAGFSGTVTINGNTVLTGASGAEGDTLQSVTDRGSTTTNHIVTDNSAGIKLTRSSFDAFAQLYPAYSNVPTLLGGGTGGLHLGYASNVSGIRIDTNNNVGIGITDPSQKLEIKADATSLANQPAEPLFVHNDGNSIDGRVFLSVKHDKISTAQALGAGLKMTAGAVTAGTASYFDSLIFLEGAAAGSDTIHSAPKAIKFYVDNHGTAAGDGNDYSQLGDLRLTIAEDGNIGIGDSTPIGDLQIGTNVFSGANGVHADDRIGLSVNGSLKSMVYASTYNNATYPDYGMVFIHGPNTGDYNVWSISPDGPAKGSGLNFIYRKDATNIHTTDPKVYFNGDGRVGIGVNDPDATLEVKGAGNTNATTSLHVRDSDDQKLFMVRNDGVVTVEHNYFYVSASAGAYVENGLRVRGSLFNDQGTLNIGNSSGTAFDGDVNFDSNTLFVDSSNNRVGIGVTTPQRKLDIRGTAGFQYAPTAHDTQGSIFLLADGSNNSYIELRDGSSDVDVKLNTAGDSYFNGGSLGVGMTSPSARLELKGGTSDSSANAFIARNSSSTSLLSVRNDGRVDIPVGPVVVDTDTLYVDTSNDRVGVNTSSPSRDLQIGNGGDNAVVAIVASNTALSQLAFGDNADDNYGQILVDHSTNKLQIQNGGGGPIIDRGITLDSSENVGIGTSSPTAQLHVHGSAGALRIHSSAGGANVYLESQAGNLSRVRWNGLSNFAIRDDNDNADRLVVTTDGNIVANDNKKFQGTTYSSSYLSFSDNTTLSANSDIVFDVNGSTELMRLEEGGNVGIGTNTPSSLLHVRGSDPVLKITDSSTTDNSATLWLQESDTYGVKLNYESNGGNGGIDYFTIDTLSDDGPNNQAGNHDNAWGIDQRGNVMPHKGAVDGNLLRPYEWLLYGSEVSGSTPSFPQNGTTAENARIYGENPFGEPAILWHTPSNDTGDNADGGWNTDTFQIDRGKSYRTSVWVKKITTNTSDGNLYLGTNYVNSLNGNYNTNPYFIGGATMASAGMETGQWYLMVGYIYDSGHSGTANHPDGGIYDRNGTKLYGANSFKFTDSGSPSNGLSSDFNKSRQRVYNYYDQTTGSKTYWWGPRFEPLEESTPTLKELLNTPSSDTGAFFMGAVGVGTSSHSQTNEVKLHVYKNANRATTIIQNNNHVARFEAYGTATAIDTTASNGVIIRNNSSNHVHFDAGGNVGIGCDDPVYKLDIQDAAAEVAQIKRTNAGNCEFLINPVGGDAKVVFQNSGTDIWSIGKDNSDSSFRISEGGALETNPRFTVDNGGNVGIGTTNPSQLLDVNGDAAFAQHLYHKGDEDTNIKFNTDEVVIHAGDVTFFRATETTQNTIKLNSDSEDTDFYLYGNNATPALFMRGSDREIGINTTNPTASLHVVGNARIKGSSSDGVLTMENAAVSQSLRIDQNSLRTNTSNNLTLFTSGNLYQLVLHQDGNVGIGTNSPNAMLQIGDGSSEATLFHSYDQYNEVKFYGFSDITDSGVWQFINDGTWDQTRFFIQDANNSSSRLTLHVKGNNGATEILAATSAGNVGIGTNSPVSKLTVESSANALADVDEPENHHLLLRNPANDTTEGVGMGFLVSAATADVGAAIVCKRVGNNAQSELQFWNKQNDAVDGVIAQSMTIAEDGKVGIGLTDPSQRLHVSENIRVGDGGASDYNRIDFTRYGGSIVGGIGWHTDAHFYIGGHPSVGPNAGNTVRVYGFGADVRLGDNTNGDVLTVKSNGNIGIGTLSPSGILDVDGVAYFRGGTTVGHIQNETDAAIILNDDDYIHSQNGGSYLRRVIGKDSAGAIHIGEPSTSIINEVKFYAGNGSSTKYTFHSGATELVRIGGNGNVGIGTDSPSGTLHVSNTGSAYTDKFIVDGSHGRLFNVSDETTGIIFSVNDAAGLPIVEVDSTSGYDKVSIGEFGTNALVVSGSGVSIGVTGSREEVLEVYPDKDESAIIGKAHVGLVGSDSDVAGFAHVDKALHTQAALRHTANGLTKLGCASSQSIQFMQNNTLIGGFNPSKDFFVDTDTLYVDVSTDRVGIGTATPDTKLEVAGVIKSSSTSRVQADTYNNSANTANIIYRSSSKTIVGNNADALVILDGGNVGIGTNSPNQELEVDGVIKQKVYTVSNLPTAGSSTMGARAFVSDSYYAYSSSYLGSQVAGGGSNFSPVYSDGNYWYIG